MKIENSTLPWERVTRSGYGQLDLKCVIGTDPQNPRILMVRRQTPADPEPGAFVVLLDGYRVSDRHWQSRADAMAEAERFFYDQPEFSSSNTGQAVKASIIMGRTAYAQGASIYANPFPQDTNPVDRANWVQGWLEQFAIERTHKIVAAAEQTARANAQLESDLNYLNASVRAHRLVMNYAAHLATTEKPKVGIDFMKDWATANDHDEFCRKYPGWVEYRDADPKAAKPEPSTSN